MARLNEYKDSIDAPPLDDLKIEEPKHVDFTLIQKIKTISETEDSYEISTNLDTISNLITENPILSNSLIGLDFQTFFGRLIELEVDQFAANLYRLLSEIISNYDGDIFQVMTEPILVFLNNTKTEDMYTFQYKLFAIINLLTRCPSLKVFFLNGLFDYVIATLQMNVQSNLLDTNQPYLINLITCFFQCNESNMENEPIYICEHQIQLFQSIFMILKKPNISLNLILSCTVCLETMIVWTINLYQFYQNEENPHEPFVLYQDESLLNELINQAIGCLKYNDMQTIASGLTILDNLLLINPQYIDNFIIDIPKCLYTIVSVNPASDIIGRIYKYMVRLIESNPDFTLAIAPDFVQQAIELCDDSSLFENKVQATRFLAVCIQMRPSTTVPEFMSNYPNIIPSLCDCFNAKEGISVWIIGALTCIIESLSDVSLNNEVFSYIYETIELATLNEMLQELESQMDPKKPQNILPMISGLRYLIRVYESVDKDE